MVSNAELAENVRKLFASYGTSRGRRRFFEPKTNMVQIHKKYEFKKLWEGNEINVDEPSVPAAKRIQIGFKPKGFVQTKPNGAKSICYNCGELDHIAKVCSKHNVSNWSTNVFVAKHLLEDGL